MVNGLQLDSPILKWILRIVGSIIIALIGFALSYIADGISEIKADVKELRISQDLIIRGDSLQGRDIRDVREDIERSEERLNTKLDTHIEHGGHQ